MAIVESQRLSKSIKSSSIFFHLPFLVHLPRLSLNIDAYDSEQNEVSKFRFVNNVSDRPSKFAMFVYSLV